MGLFLPFRTSLHSLPIPWQFVPTETLDCPCSTALCPFHTEGGRGPRHRPRASRQTPHTSGRGTLSSGGLERESNGRFSLTECPRLRHFQP